MSGVSIVLVSWNSLDMIRSLLTSLLPLDFGHELIVVDNDSADGSADAIEREFKTARVIRNERNLGFAGGANTGLRVARLPLVLLLNPDTLAAPDAIRELAEYMDAHPEAGVVGPRVLNDDGTIQSSRFRFPSVAVVPLLCNQQPMPTENRVRGDDRADRS